MERDYLAEAIRIARGETMLVPEREHLEALQKQIQDLQNAIMDRIEFEVWQ
jgi:hypothetical protein